MHILNIAAYKFVALNELPALRLSLKEMAISLEIKGTILMSPEGMNLMLAGTPKNIREFQSHLQNDIRFSDLQYKEGVSTHQPFKKLFVKIKKEIIAFGIQTIDPVNDQAPYLKPFELKKWLDENRDIFLLDTRNDYEIKMGTFENAQDLNIHHFRDFPREALKLDATLKEKVVVTFCTGGIRCEKAALLLQHYGFKKIYQLEGGILNYFTECGRAHYQGDCYVFDEREKVSPT